MENKNTTLSFTAIIKNEAPYIIEWIEYHKLVGVEKFYLYDNGSTDNIKEILKPYIEEGTVVYHEFPGIGMQKKAYMDAIRRYQNDTKYMGFIDIDEFVIPTKEDNLVSIIEETLNNDPNAAGLAINWRIYGSNHYEKMPTGLVTENYTLRARDDFEANKHIKTICNPRMVAEFTNAHFPIYKENYYNVDEKNKRVDGPFNEGEKCERIRINHYFSKSKIEYILKSCRGRVSDGSKRPMSDFERHDQNDIEDRITARFLPLVRQNYQKRVSKIENYPDYPSIMNKTNPNLLKENITIRDRYFMIRNDLLRYYDILKNKQNEHKNKK